MHRPKDQQAAEMWALYESGQSLCAIARLYGLCDTTVHALLTRRGHKLRPSPRAKSRAMWKAVKYKGKRYTPGKDGYLRCTRRKGRSVFLHRVIWEEHHGPIPAGMCVGFKDLNRVNCSIDNLELTTIADIQRRNGGGNNMHTRGLAKRSKAPKPCPVCGKMFGPHPATPAHPNQEGPAAFSRRRHCSTACAGVSKRGKPRTTRRAVVNWRAMTPPRVDRRLAAIDAAKAGLIVVGGAS